MARAPETIREQAAAAWEKMRAENEAMALERARDLKERLVGLGFAGERLTVAPGCVEADREGLTFKADQYGIQVRDHDWPEGRWCTFYDVAGLGAVLAVDPAEDPVLGPSWEVRVADVLEDIAAALEACREP